MVETLIANEEFEQKMPREVEQTFVPIFPDRLSGFRTEAYPIEQPYLSHPAEPFSLRLREACIDGNLRYTAALKDRGILTSVGIDRLEVETEINPETYAYYKADELPILRKLRAEPMNNIAIDFFEDDQIQIESESPLSWRAFADRTGVEVADVTDNRVFDNEWRAHFAYRRAHGGREAFMPQAAFDIDAICRDIITAYHKSPRTIAQIAGRSGSGKSTYVNQIKAQLEVAGISCDVISTDDYHRGASWLREYNGGEEWTAWDDPIVYDTAALANDIRTLIDGQPVTRRKIDFSIAEPAYDGLRQPASVLLVEGIYTRSPDLANLYDLSYEVPTPLATCIGRRLLRDFKERPQFSDPAASLRYMLEQAEPAYRRQAAS